MLWKTKNTYVIKKYILALLIVMTATLVMAQGMSTGITVGYANSNHFPRNETHTAMPGFQLGGLAQLPLGSWDLQGELRLASKGFIAHSIGDTYLTNLFLYVELPLSMKYELLPNDTWNIYLLGGITARWKVIAINLVSELDGIRSFDAGVHAGLGLCYRKLALEARFDQGIVNFDLIEPQKFHQTLSLGMNFYFSEN
ncbi:MAG: outer membrane beta-barrel protein [Candidatus Marinimicrobia bacterium]|nr:outer membrane beta-barrel protein [Candidatus Neomarinimicrobiota bacterium]